jgi:hypothetical protein
MTRTQDGVCAENSIPEKTPSGSLMHPEVVIVIKQLNKNSDTNNSNIRAIAIAIEIMIAIMTATRIGGAGIC